MKYAVSMSVWALRNLVKIEPGTDD